MHQYVERTTGKVVTEKIFHDRVVNFIYSELRERTGKAFKLVVAPRTSALIAWTVFDLPRGRRRAGVKAMLKDLALDLNECHEKEQLTTPRRIFERKIRYWETRPLPPCEGTAACPADSRVCLGSFRTESSLFLKEKFFSYPEILGSDKERWLAAFEDGDYAIFRLTPDKYHWNHVPVSGRVLDYYEIDGSCHSCNPGAVVAEVTPYSKNHRHVTVIDTDVEGGSRLGLVAMVEVVALMIGGIRQAYCEALYDNPREMAEGLFLRRGQPKSLFTPGSSVDVLLFQKDRLRFSEDLRRNSLRRDVTSRFSVPFGRTLVETEVLVRSELGDAL